MNFDSIKELNDDYFIIDLFRSKPISKKLVNLLSKTNKIIVVDEQTQYGNLSTAVQSEMSKFNLHPHFSNLCLPDDYVFENGGRDYLLKRFNLDEISIFNECNKIL